MRADVGAMASTGWTQVMELMMRGTGRVVAVLGVVAVAQVAYSHFLVLLPSSDVVEEPGAVHLQMLFTHPMRQGPVMEMGAPRRFGVMVKGSKRDLTKMLKTRKVQGKTTYSAAFRIEEPGDHVFYIEPAPYWEPSEQKMIVHYTKVVVNGLGEQVGWDQLVGLPVEIEPLVRPYGLWTGNVFRGIVRVSGRPMPFAEIEVEYWNEGKKVAAPTDASSPRVEPRVWL